MERQSRTEQPAMIRVWDPFVRSFHWLLALAVGMAFLSGDELLGLHVRAGSLILGLVLLRIVWGLIGPRHARFSDFLYFPSTIIAYLRDLVRFRAARYLGHGPAGGSMVIALLLALMLTTLSGLALYGGQEYAGPFWRLMAGLDDRWTGVVKAAHEFFAGLTAALIGLHVAGVLFSSFAHRENLIRSMITGEKRHSGAEEQGAIVPKPATGRPALDERMVI